MSSALSPSTWYTWLLTYKRGHPERHLQLAALSEVFISTHGAELTVLLGGPPSIVTVVPSKQGVPNSMQPLRAALARCVSIRPLLRETLIHAQGLEYERRQYNAQTFAPGPESVKGERVVLIEDTWVTGATAVSAAGALLRDGASAVAIVPIARMVNVAFVGKDHPYCIASKKKYDPDVWPR